MASFRTGFKIFGEFSLKQGLGRIRSFSEDRKPGQWLPEDQWAVRQPGSTCPDLCEKPKKPPKTSKSWLSICKDPPKKIECDVRHNNCPHEPKEETPWYSLDNFIPKKKPQEKLPPLRSCREEMRRRELCREEEVCENIQDTTFPENIKPEPSECCMPREPCPAPVVTLSCPLPKELDIMLWCERPCTNTSRIPIPCQSDRLPYDEFRPQKCWKPPPFSLPIKGDPCPPFLSGRCTDSIAYAEFKQVDVPRPLYTRYKSVELSDKNMLLCMTDVKCPDDKDKSLLPVSSPLPVCLSQAEPCEGMGEKQTPCEKPILEAASCKPVRIKKAPKYTFRPKLTKLVERCIKKNPICQHKTCGLPYREEIDGNYCTPTVEMKDSEPPNIITRTLTNEPQTFEREIQLPQLQCSPPKWMYVICKPGSRKTPLIPFKEVYASEPDNSSETDGLKFYDGKDDGIQPKPPPDPCLAQETTKEQELLPIESETLSVEPPQTCFSLRDRFVLMPEKYNIKFLREEGLSQLVDESQSSTLENFISKKTASTQKCSKSYPPMKENILYDLQRLCPNPPLDPSKLNSPCRKPPQPDCPQLPRFYRSFSTLQPSTLRKTRALRLCKIQQRTECEDTPSKCKARQLTPRPKPCPETVSKPECAEITLPCCPKARIPPDCDFRRPMPICKKKLPPKPSFSECSKDPPPCPRITECDCWEKKLGGKNRK